MKIGEYVYARTHAELLNELLGTNYKGWMKDHIILSDKMLWMIELGNFVSSSGWMNRLVGDKVSEKLVDKKFETHTTYKTAPKVEQMTSWRFYDRIVFDVEKGGSVRKYIFRGVFRPNPEESTINENIWDLILDEYNL